MAYVACSPQRPPFRPVFGAFYPHPTLRIITEAWQGVLRSGGGHPVEIVTLSRRSRAPRYRRPPTFEFGKERTGLIATSGPFISVCAMRVIPITDSEPVSIVKPEPPVAAGQGSGNQARTTTPLGTQWSARSDVERGMWRGGMSPIGSRARTRPVKGVVVGWATAESPAAGCGAGRDRMTSVLSRGSPVRRWRRWIRAWGSDEPVTDDPAA